MQHALPRVEAELAELVQTLLTVEHGETLKQAQDFFKTSLTLAQDLGTRSRLFTKENGAILQLGPAARKACRGTEEKRVHLRRILAIGVLLDSVFAGTIRG